MSCIEDVVWVWTFVEFSNEEAKNIYLDIRWKFIEIIVIPTAPFDDQKS